MRKTRWQVCWMWFLGWPYILLALFADYAYGQHGWHKTETVLNTIGYCLALIWSWTVLFVPTILVLNWLLLLF